MSLDLRTTRGAELLRILYLHAPDRYRFVELADECWAWVPLGETEAQSVARAKKAMAWLWQTAREGNIDVQLVGHGRVTEGAGEGLWWVEMGIGWDSPVCPAKLYRFGTGKDRAGLAPGEAIVQGTFDPRATETFATDLTIGTYLRDRILASCGRVAGHSFRVVEVGGINADVGAIRTA
jgi:hypothetical protein